MDNWRESTTTSDDEINIDTIALLQDEIARLEAEIRSRDDARISDDLTATRDAHHHYEDVEPFRLRVNELSNELAAREETIELLLEQARFYEDAATVQRAEWDELQRWVEEVERRMGSSDGEESEHRARLDVERNRFDGLNTQSQADRAAWELQRRGLEQEINRLRSLASQTPSNAAAVSALAQLDDENRKLQKRCQSLESSATTTPEVEPLRKKLAETLARFDASEVAHRRAGDEWSKEKSELTAVLAAAQGQVAREALLASTTKPQTMDTGAKSPAIEADERIRAFREHLQDLHRRESEERANRGGLSSRLSKLWHHSTAK